MMIIICILITSCNSSYASNKVPQEQVPHINKIEQSISPDKNGNLKQDNEDFYGEWVVKGVISSGPIGSITTHSDEDLKYFEGKRIIYKPDVAGFEDELIRNPFYKKTTVSKEQFYKETEISFEELGINKDTCIEVEVYLDSNFRKPWIGGKKIIGQGFLIKDKNTLIVGNGGDFFELTRK